MTNLLAVVIHQRIWGIQMGTVLSWAIKEDDFGNSPKDKADETEIRGQEKIR